MLVYQRVSIDVPLILELCRWDLLLPPAPPRAPQRNRCPRPPRRWSGRRPQSTGPVLSFGKNGGRPWELLGPFMISHDSSWFFMILDDFSWFFMIFHDSWWFFMILDVFSWFLMISHDDWGFWHISSNQKVPISPCKMGVSSTKKGTPIMKKIKRHHNHDENHNATESNRKTAGQKKRQKGFSSHSSKWDLYPTLGFSWEAWGYMTNMSCWYGMTWIGMDWSEEGCAMFCWWR